MYFKLKKKKFLDYHDNICMKKQ